MDARKLREWFVLILLPLTPAIAAAQATSAIAGVVRDTSGAVLPGATVEASSPVLIEKTRSAITDSQGNYKVIDLRPGTYVVTISLPGFNTYRREGIELTSGFTGTVNADLRVGALEETVTVTGASPIVDVQNARTQQVLKAETINQLPSGGKNMSAFAALTLGAVPSTPGRNDVGGDKNELNTGIVLHGGRGDDGRTNWDGMNTNTAYGGGGGQNRNYFFNMVSAQEVVVDTSGNMAETETGGANVNIVPREGANTFSAYGLASYTGNRFSAKSVPEDMKTSRNIGDQSSLKLIYDYGLGIGGPFKRDKAWFYATHRSWGAQNYAANNYFDKDPSPYRYAPDLNRPAYGDSYFGDDSVRITLQAAPKHKLTHEFHLQNGCNCWYTIGGGGQVAPDASPDFTYGPQVLNQTSWTFTATNRLLIQGGVNFLRQEVNSVTDGAVNANKFTGASSGRLSGPGAFSITETLGVPGGAPAGYTYGAQGGGVSSNAQNIGTTNYNQRIVVAYITGSHAFKAGVQTGQLHYDLFGMQGDVEQMTYTFRGGVPISLTQFAGPFQSLYRLRNQGLFLQDQWTFRQLTISGGLRFDHFNGRALAQDIPAGRFRPAFHVDEQKNIPDFKDVTYRFGAVYDIFGNGKTAIKVAWGKYLAGLGGALAQQGFLPSVALVTSSGRGWTDTNGNFEPDCNLNSFAANGECLALQNPLFGQPFVAQTLAADVRQGWGNREYNYQWNVQLHHELLPRVGIALGYFHTQWGNITVTRNTRRTPDDYTSYCVPVPTDARLGATSGQSVCGYFEATPTGLAKGAAFEITQASRFGEPKDYFNGFDIGLNARWGSGALATGGVTVGREVFDFCYANGHPELTPQNFAVGATSPARYPRNDQFCRIAPSWWNGIGSQAKFQVVYPLPYDVVISGTFKNMPGIPVPANYVLTNAQLAPYLGRPSTAAGTVTHSVIPLQGNSSATVFDERLNQTDLRLSKIIRFGRHSVQGMLDLYNVFNARTPQAINATYGTTFLRPSSLLGGRLLKFGTQVDW